MNRVCDALGEQDDGILAVAAGRVFGRAEW